MRKTIDLVNRQGVDTGTDSGTDSGTDPGEDVLEAVHAVMHLFRTQQYRVSRGGAPELTHMDGKVLGFFARQPGATQRQLAAHSGRDKGQLARLVAGLKDRGLLDARADDADRRNIRLTLTEDGRSVHLALQQQRRQLAQAAVAGMTADERRQIVALLDRVRANLAGRS